MGWCLIPNPNTRFFGVSNVAFTIQNILDWMLPEENAAEEAADALMPMAESDVRTVAPDDEADTLSARTEKGRELTGILLAVFLILMLIEMGVCRYVG